MSAAMSRGDITSHHDVDQQQPHGPTDSVDQPRRRRYKTEYKKKFRPFSLYQYVDGKFQKSSSDKISVEASAGQPTVSLDGKTDTWYHEVLELRKKAGEYKYRGIGGELMPQHVAELYAKQLDVWEQVSRRSSLSALSLAAIAPKPAGQSDSRSSSAAGNNKRSSPAKTAPAQQTAAGRPGHAQPVLVASRKENMTPARNGRGGDAAERPKRDLSQQRSVSAEGSKSRAPRSAKPMKSPAHGGTQQQQTGGNVTLAIRPSLGAIFHPMNRTSKRSASVGPERRMPKSSSSSSNNNPAGGTVTKTTPVKARPAAVQHNNNDGIEPGKVASSQTTPTDEGKENSGPSSLPALIKAAPEPTRVKSPEQLVVRSPDPVNWTVPLDTGKTFTVTQNIRGGDGSRPHSELKVSMTVRPPASAVQQQHAKQSEVSVQQEPEMMSVATSNNKGAPEAEADVPVVVEEVKPTEEAAPLGTEDPEEDPVDEPEQNGLEADVPLLAKEQEEKTIPAAVEAVTSIVPGTTLRRLEDPTPFLFSTTRPGTLGGLGSFSLPAAPVEQAAPKAPRYRVLEAEPAIIEQPYKVLEAPSSPAAASPNASPSSSRSLASDVLEKARTRFDRFWTKKDGDK